VQVPELQLAQQRVQELQLAQRQQELVAQLAQQVLELKPLVLKPRARQELMAQELKDVALLSV
jgi:hypothetical protein